MNGKKTYIVCALTITYAVVALVLGKIDANSAMEMIFGALAAAGLRDAVKKAE